MKDYEQMYYDSQYKIRQLEKRIKELENDLMLVKGTNKNKLNIKKEIFKELEIYRNREVKQVEKI